MRSNRAVPAKVSARLNLKLHRDFHPMTTLRIDSMKPGEERSSDSLEALGRV